MTALARSRLGFLAVCVALVVLYLSWWVTYSETHQSPRYDQLPAGQALELPDGTVRVVSLALADELVRPKGDGDPAVADQGSIWAVATVEVVKRKESDRIWCSVDLLATNGRIWSEGGPSFERSLPGCDSSEIVVGRPYRFEAIFLAPRRDAASLAGLAVDDPTSARRIPVLSP